MSIKCTEIIDFLEEIAPISLAEDWDNVGLLLGDPEKDIERIMVCLDVALKVAEEAIDKKADLIISHHPIIYKGLKRITNDDAKGRVILRLIKNSISVYCAHTNLDIAEGGVNSCLAGLLGLSEIRNLCANRKEKLYKIVVFVPEEYVDAVRGSMSLFGAGHIGNYSDCSFTAKGTGTFRPLENTNPFIGTKGKLEKVAECRVETVVTFKNIKPVIEAMKKAHPYEEVAYDVYPLEVPYVEYGLGKVGILDEPMAMDRFIEYVKDRLKTDWVRIAGNTDRHIKRVAVFSGSFDSGLLATVKESADALVTGDLKYHTALEASENGVLIIDAGHFGTEKAIVPALVDLLKSKFKGKDVDVIQSMVEQNPLKFC